MTSYIFLFISSLLALYPKNIYKRKTSFYSLIFSSIIFSHISLGFISLILIHLNLSKFPLIIICSLLFLFLFLRKNNSFQKLLEIKNFLKREWEILKKKNEINNSQKSIFIFLLILVTFLFLSSIGPINHPDAADYHVGYPYQYYLRGGFFIDGGLHQGLLGIGDYANLSFIQEHNIWLIRSIQIINLPLIILFLSKEVRNNNILIAFLTVPTFIQWSTIGKPLFLGESSLIILYLIWKDNQSSYNLKLLIITMLSCIAYKISALIIIFPIFIDIAKYATNKINLKNNFIEEIKYIIFSKEILFTIIVLFSIFIERQIIIGNFAFPLLTNIFNNNDLVINEFSKTIMNYQRNTLSFLKIFIPTKISELSTFLGPSILFIYIATLIFNLKNFPKYNNDIFFITTSQILLLLLFAQGRADYYTGPLILIIYESKNLGKIISKSISEFILNFTNIFQLTIISFYILFSIYYNLSSFKNYTKSMNHTAYGFNISQKINNSLSGNFYITDRNTRLYYPENYIDKDKMQRCINKNLDIDESERKDICFKQYDIEQSITGVNEKINLNIYDCKIIKSIRSSRNIFNRKDYNIKNCIKKNNNKL